MKIYHNITISQYQFPLWSSMMFFSSTSILYTLQLHQLINTSILHAASTPCTTTMRNIPIIYHAVSKKKRVIYHDELVFSTIYQAVLQSQCNISTQRSRLQHTAPRCIRVAQPSFQSQHSKYISQ